MPVRLADWHEKGERIVLERPRPRGSGWRGLGAKLTYSLAPRRLRLDELGGFSWLCFDGHTPLAEVCEALRERFGDEIEQVEERLDHFVRLLLREGMVRLEDA